MKQVKVSFVDDETEEEIEVLFPAVELECENCSGKGTHLADSLRDAVFTAEDMREDPDFAEEYFGGGYDVQCKECGGSGKALYPDDERASKEPFKALWAKYIEWEKAESYYASEREAERRMGY